MVRTEDGGRRSPIFDGYRAALTFGELTEDGVPIVNGSVVVFEDAEHVAPGAAGTARAFVAAPDYLPPYVASGLEFTVNEGRRVVARARVAEVLRDDTVNRSGFVGGLIS
ncbi:hypothetical protein LRS13_08195 [Svornostia abyssi]|uniref:Uncharacterized protein n=1 Tax=Svornostia abyssi TaxID=2898438 RepID=A0ABY5PLS8_9ACTN|nr:hypothetical protein LRS13_08195 [Parviterribacteraceae bacterium J379]